MFKKMLLLLTFIGLLSCEQENEDSIISQEPQDNVSSEIINDLFQFKDWDEFGKTYAKFSKLTVDELKTISFYDYEKNIEASPAINGILNKENKFMVDNKVIWFHKGNFYELDDTVAMKSQKPDISQLKEVGSVSQQPLYFDTSSNTESRGRVIINNQKEFRKQSYIERCGNGKIQGPSPRAFKFVDEVYHELVIYGFRKVYYYSLRFRTKLEYNRRRRSWRHSGESREISINLNNSSFMWLYGAFPIPTTTNGHYIRRSITFNSNCSSNQDFLLYSIDAAGMIPGASWVINLSGTVTQKMVGDVNRNRWRDVIQW